MQTYDPEKYQIIVHGNKMVGIADGTFIKASRNNDGYTLSMSADGSGARVKNPDKSGRFEVTLKRFSPSNDILAGIAALDELTGTEVDATYIADGNGTSYALGAESWIVKQGDIEGAKEIGDITWIVETALLEQNPGGIIDT